MRTRRCTIALATGLVALWLAPAAAADPAPSGPRVQGVGSGIFLVPPFVGDRVTIAVDAFGSPSVGTMGTARGRFEVAHFDKTGGEFARFAGKVTCLAVHGSTAFITGEIERGHGPDVIGDPVGQAFSITLADHGRADLAGLAPPSRLAAGCSPVPLDTVIDQGDYTVTS
jgi:hypothetical protein